MLHVGELDTAVSGFHLGTAADDARPTDIDFLNMIERLGYNQQSGYKRLMLHHLLTRASKGYASFVLTKFS